MKKALSVLMTLALLFSFAAMIGCSTAEDEPSATPTAAQTSDAQGEPTEPAETGTDYSGLPVTDYHGKSVPELIAEGIAPLVGLTFPVLSDPFLVELVGALEKNFQSNGLDTLAVSAEGDITKQIEQVENFTTMGAVAIVIGAMSMEALVTANVAAIEAGVIVTSLGGVPTNYEISGGIANDWENLGKAAGQMAIAYLDVAHPDAPAGSILTAFAMNSSLADPKRCSEFMKATIEADPRVNIVFEKDLVMEIDTGYTFAEEALTADPGITLFVMYIEASAIGANNYLASLPNVDFSKYAIFCTSGGEDFMTVLEMSRTNESAVRGTIKYGGSDPSSLMFKTTYEMLIGEHEVPYWEPEPCWSENTFGWQYSADGDGEMFGS